jgi:hypothetical protein
VTASVVVVAPAAVAASALSVAITARTTIVELGAVALLLLLAALAAFVLSAPLFGRAGSRRRSTKTGAAAAATRKAAATAAGKAAATTAATTATTTAATTAAAEATSATAGAASKATAPTGSSSGSRGRTVEARAPMLACGLGRSVIAARRRRSVATRPPRTRLAHRQATTIEHRSVEVANRFGQLLGVTELHEREAP